MTRRTDWTTSTATAHPREAKALLLMLAFTFPGQGSQKPGMGLAWVDHPSWELVGDASDVVGRDIADNARRLGQAAYFIAVAIIVVVVLEFALKIGGLYSGRR